MKEMKESYVHIIIFFRPSGESEFYNFPFMKSVDDEYCPRFVPRYPRIRKHSAVL